MPTKQYGVDFDAATTPLDGTETLSIVQGGVTVDCTTQDIADLVSSIGDVTGPVSSVDGNLCTFSGITGKSIQDGGKTITQIRQIEQNSQSAAYSLVLTDAGKHIFHPSADTTARVWTIPANASVPYPIGTAITFVNQSGAGVITISITSDTMRLAGAGTTGSRTLAANGIATALKITSTEWIISGTGLT